MGFSRNPEVIDDILEEEGPAYRALDTGQRERYNRQLFVLAYFLEGASREYIERLRDIQEFSPGELEAWKDSYGSLSSALQYGMKNIEDPEKEYDLAVRDEILENLEVETPEQDIRVEQIPNEDGIIVVERDNPRAFISADENLFQDPPR